MAVERAPRTLDEAAGDRDGSTTTLCDLLADPVAGDGYDRVDERSEIEQLEGLPGGLAERERNIVRAHYGFDGSSRLSARSRAGWASASSAFASSRSAPWTSCAPSWLADLRAVAYHSRSGPSAPTPHHGGAAPRRCGDPRRS